MSNELKTRAEWFIELLNSWENLIVIASRPPMTPGKVIMSSQLENAITWLKKTYDVEDLMNIKYIEDVIDEQETQTQKLLGDGADATGSQHDYRSDQPDGSGGESKDAGRDGLCDNTA